MPPVVLLVVGTAGAGNYSPPPGDGAPAWLANGSVAYLGQGGVGAVNADGTGLHVVSATGGWPLLAAPTKPLVAFTGYEQTTSKPWLTVAATDGSSSSRLIEDGVPLGWVPDSSRLIFYLGSVYTSQDQSRIYSIRPDGSGQIAYPSNVHGTPSPDGTRFAWVKGNDNPKLHVINADGSGDVVLQGDPPAGPGDRLFWSPDSTRIAYSSFGLTVTGIVGGSRTYVIHGEVGNGSIAWAPDGRTVYVDSESGLVQLTLADGRTHILRGIAPISGVAVSPDGTQIAYAAGGECRDRSGIYIANADGSDRHRVSNSCRIYGTDGPDTLHGDFSQVLLGLGGDDTLYADDNSYFFDGISLYGGPDNDKLYGGYARDDLYGGPGDDYLSGGPSKDLLIGGPGHDHISSGGGNDLIGAQDGERDWITCGTNLKSDGIRDHDVVYADRIDVVAHDCEVVHRR